MNILKDRNEPMPSDEIMNISNKIKEKYCYVSKNIIEEFEKYDTLDSRISNKWKVYKGKNKFNEEKFQIDIGYERFLGPEMFFNPVYTIKRVFWIKITKNLFLNV